MLVAPAIPTIGAATPPKPGSNSGTQDHRDWANDCQHQHQGRRNRGSSLAGRYTVLLNMKSMVAAKIGGWESLSRGVSTGHP